MNDIIINGLTIGYGNRVVAGPLSCRIEGGALTCLVARNGAGKSTLLRTIAGMQRPVGEGRPIRIMTDGESGDAPERRRVDGQEMSRLVAVVLTERPQLRRLTVWQVAAMGRIPHTGWLGTLREADRSAVAEALREVGMEAFAGRDIGTLSDGERQKVMIARALAQQTPVLLLDEPTAFLDYPSKVAIMRLLARLAHGTGRLVLASTHDLDLALRFADRLLTISQGGLREMSKDELRREMASL